MVYTTLDSGSNIVTVDNGDRITKIGTRDTDLYVNGFRPIGEGQFTFRARILHPIPIEFQKFLTVDANFTPQYGPTVVIMGQSEPEKDNFWTKQKGPDAPESIENIVFDEADIDSYYGCFKVFTRDQFDGQMVADLFTVDMFHNSVTGGNRLTGVPGADNFTPTPLFIKNISLKTQYDVEKDHRKICGDAMFSVMRSDVSENDLSSAAYFEITPPDGVALRFTIWEGGLKQGNDFRFDVYLKRTQ